MGNKKAVDKKRLNKLAKDYGISMSQFISKVLGVRNKQIMFNEITHADLKQLFPDLVRTGYDVVLDDPEALFEGEVVLVFDAKGNYIPYRVRNYDKETEYDSIMYQDTVSQLPTTISDTLGLSQIMDEEEWNMDMGEIWKKEPSESTPIYSRSDLQSLTTYELSQLLRLYKATHQAKMYRLTHDELISREDSKQASRRSISQSRAKEKKYQRRYES